MEIFFRVTAFFFNFQLAFIFLVSLGEEKRTNKNYLDEPEKKQYDR